ncbi:VOC family protein [Sphingorhabdus sp. SMR4y]|uniref:VOC family protein n=1 Tax=Sphingorhabdus sp. SMR4y TaxID=2584094 RepID=UPI000B5CF676|nr:VOC family protein [Sphingorhabdus sp. SMR4y]ASK89899.1 glyoxalase [Sphingorhabdus sp. SMR4y]
MKLGAFSISLSVKDIAASRAFYEKLGFVQFGGDQEQKWLILKNGETTLGLFEGMFPRNMLTFNPGWDQSAQNLDDFDDVRAIEKSLLEAGVTLDSRTEGEQGPASIMLTDPDGNPILIDQHR